MKKILLVFLVFFCSLTYAQKSYQRTLVVTDPCIGNGITNSTTDEGFNVFPNPGIGIINLSLPENGTAILTDLQGAIVHQIEVGSTAQWDLSGISSGIYMLSLYTETRLFRTKLILE